MRSMGAPALVSHALSHTDSHPLEKSPLAWLATPKAATAFQFLALGEIVGDKLPMTPNRIDPGPLFGRAASGALSGAAIFQAEGEQAGVGAAIGLAAAVVSAFAFYHLRHLAGEAKIVPDPVLGGIEDLLAYGVGWSVLLPE